MGTYIQHMIWCAVCCAFSCLFSLMLCNDDADIRPMAIFWAIVWIMIGVGGLFIKLV
jgi:hypothetical protein